MDRATDTTLAHGASGAGLVARSSFFYYWRFI
jgi:hypothetical protein